MSVVYQILYPETAARSTGGDVFGSCSEVTGFEVETKQASITETSSLRTIRWSRARATGTPPYHLPREDTRESEGKSSVNRSISWSTT